ncbi:hypothetical protein ES702_01839 [subsurface metagenome]
MYRARLRTRTGCLSCRRRRKKCDDRRPRCSPCQRLRLPCEWGDGPISASEEASSPERGTQVSFDTKEPTTIATSIAITSLPSKQRIADHDGLDRRKFELPTGITQDLSNYYETQPIAVAPTEVGEMRHILILGVFEGWDQVAPSVRSHETWLKVVHLDNLLRLFGHGKAARLALGLLSLALTQVSISEFRVDRAELSLLVPSGAKSKI